MNLSGNKTSSVSAAKLWLNSKLVGLPDMFLSVPERPKKMQDFEEALEASTQSVSYTKDHGRMRSSGSRP